MVNPWAITGALGALILSVLAGMYVGDRLATAQYQKEKLELAAAHSQALEAKSEALRLATRASEDVSARFEAALRDIKIVNTTYRTEVRNEVEKLVYTDCKIPDTGVDLLKRQVDSVNMRLIGAQK